MPLFILHCRGNILNSVLLFLGGHPCKRTMNERLYFFFLIDALDTYLDHNPSTVYFCHNVSLDTLSPVSYFASDSEVTSACPLYECISVPPLLFVSGVSTFLSMAV